MKLRRLPSVARVLETAAVREAMERLPRTLLVDSIRAEIDSLRQEASGGAAAEGDIAARAIARSEAAQQPALARAINATGVVLHKGLGRAVLPEAALRAVQAVAQGHANLEIDLESGQRGSRQDHVRSLLCELTGARSALVVNNNAGATLLAVAALAAGRQVIISRGELVEIGGAFRMPDIIRAAGASLVEVGTTNRTRLRDFEAAISQETGLLLRCHPSNFRIVGFTEEVDSARLAQLGNKHGIPVVDDLGSGALMDTEMLGAGPTVTLRAAVEAGSSVVTASGDKLLGGPQSGILLGGSDAIARIAAHPLARALRVDKMTLAALEATLRLYRDPESARRQIPTLRYLSRTASELGEMARALKEAICARSGPGLQVDLVESHSQVGGGSLPGENLPTVCVRVRPSGGLSADRLAAALRCHRPPVFGRIRDDSILLDPRTLETDEFGAIAAALEAAT